ncbi:MAG: hypothetical protein ACJ74J_00810 [Blastocatellia bacterium]
MNGSKCLPALLLAIVMAACSAPANRNSGNANNAATANAPISTNDSAAAMEGLVKAVSAQMNARSFRARVDSTTGNVEAGRDIEYVAPDRFRIKSQDDEYIIIGNTIWTRQKDGPWQKQTVDTAQLLASVRDPQMVDQIRKNAEIRFTGPDTLDGKPMTVYEYTLRKGLRPDMTNNSKVWISSADNLPRRMQNEVGIGNQISKSTITYFDYNTDIKIEPPK